MGLKEAYQDKMHAELKEWQAKIDMLKAKAGKAEAEQKIKYYEQIESLRTKQQQVHEKLDGLRSASESAWEEAKAGVEIAWEDLKLSVERAVEKFK
jgi:uncharacterized coiled-coil DUF342 family protein